MDLRLLYQNNKDFKDYVDRCAKTRKMTIEEVLSLMLTRNYAEYLLELALSPNG